MLTLLANSSFKLESVSPPHSSEHLQCPDIFNPSRRTPILERNRSHEKPNLTNGSWVGEVFQSNYIFFLNELLDRVLSHLECWHHRWTIVRPKLRPFYTKLHITLSTFYIINLVDSLALWNDTEVNDTPDVEGSDRQCLHLWLPHVSFLGSWRCQFLPSHISSFAFQVILKHHHLYW